MSVPPDPHSPSSASDPRDVPTLEARLVRTLVAILGIAVAGVAFLLPYRLYERDIEHAHSDAHRVAALVSAAFGDALGRGEDPTRLAARLEDVSGVGIALEPAGGAVADARAPESELDGVLLTVRTAPVRAPDGTAWVATLRFDLTGAKRASVQVIVQLLLAVVVGASAFSAAIFTLVRHGLLVPLGEVTRRISLAEQTGGVPRLPSFSSREMATLAAVVERACATRSAR